MKTYAINFTRDQARAIAAAATDAIADRFDELHAKYCRGDFHLLDCHVEHERKHAEHVLEAVREIDMVTDTAHPMAVLAFQNLGRIRVLEGQVRDAMRTRARQANGGAR